MATKDLFSDQSKAYAAFRPTYPKALYDFVFARVKNFDTAWDCATGNGQVARYLCNHFKEVFATDISQQQLDEAFTAPNIFYAISKAEETPFADGSFDLITVGQALHWINTDLFYKEVKRVGKPGSCVAVWGYSLLRIEPGIDGQFEDFYFNTVGSFWDAARKMVENKYGDVPFPFADREEGEFEIVAEWNRHQFAGYLTSWSATQRFIKHNQVDPVPAFMSKLGSIWKEDDVKQVRFPVFVKVGSV